jgi:NADH-quinone oxidoreductase subunit L
MLLLILGSNYFVLFFGWEGVGICSYLLIGFHYSDAEKGMANSIAARKAFIMNRIGDAGLLIGLFLIIAQFNTLEFTGIAEKLSLDPTLANGAIIGITLCLFIAATGKSAQIPLFIWLPDAMAGPTPVSALIHAATMVTAGIYLVVRSNFLFELAPLTKDIILAIGFATSMIAAFIAMRQNDIKKVLAYSTVSQLGLMFVALGMGAYTVAIFHVTTHAFFKALLFLGSGSVIHAMSDEQDIRLMGGLAKKLPITHLTFLIGTLAIAGFPLLSGFGAKVLTMKNLLPWQVVGMNIAALGTAISFAKFIFLPHSNQDQSVKATLKVEFWVALSILLGGLVVANVVYFEAYDLENIAKPLIIIGIGWIAYWLIFRSALVKLPTLFEKFENLIGVMSLMLILLFWMALA